MISTRGRYALRVMIDLAEQGRETYTPLKEVAERQRISKKYIEAIMASLSKAGLVDAVHGKGGGYRLNRDAKEYTVGEIIELTEGPLAPVACLADDAAACPRSENCLTLPLWKEYYQLIHDFFYNKKLSDLLTDRSPVYYI